MTKPRSMARAAAAVGTTRNTPPRSRATFMRIAAASLLLFSALSAHGSLRAQSAPSVTVPRDGKLDLAALLTKLDPGPQEPLSRQMAPATCDRIRKSASAEAKALVERSKGLDRGAATRFFRELASERLAFDFDAWRETMAWIVLLEDAAAAASGPSAQQADLLLGIYERLVTARVNQRLVEQITEAAGAARDGGDAREQLAALRSLVGDGSRAAELRARKLAVELLQAGAAAGVRAVALRHLTKSLGEGDDPQLQVALLEEAARTDPASTDAEEWQRLGNAYCDCFLVEHARACQVRVRASRVDTPGADQAQLARRIAIADQARDLRGSKALEQRLAHAHLLLDLAQRAEARSAFAKLAAEHPSDARARLGLARVAFEQLDDALARRELDAAQKLEPKDARHHALDLSLSLAELPLALGREAARGDPARTVALARAALARLDPLVAATQDADDPQTAHARAVVQIARAAFGTGRDDAGQLDGDALCRRGFAGRHADLRALVRRFPGRFEFEQLVRSAALFAATAAEAVEDLSSLPPSPAVAESWLAVAVRHDKPEYAERVESLLGPAETRWTADWCLAGTMHAVVARLRGEKKRWEEVRQCFEKALATPTELRERGLNGLAVAQFECGDAAAAQATFRRSREPESTQVLKANRVLATRGERSRDALSRLLVDKDDERAGPPCPEALVHAWLSVCAETAREKDTAQAEAKEAVELAGEQPQERGLGKAGMLVDRSANWGFRSRRYEPRELDARIDKLVWLAVPPPVTIEELRRRALR